MATKKTRHKTTDARTAWLLLVKQTLNEIAEWAAAERWAVETHDKRIEEEPLGTYSVPVLTIQLPSGRLHVEPIARYVAGADGRIDLLSFPVLNRLTLLRKRGVWIVRTDSGINYPGA